MRYIYLGRCLVNKLKYCCCAICVNHKILASFVLNCLAYFVQQYHLCIICVKLTFCSGSVWLGKRYFHIDTLHLASCSSLCRLLLIIYLYIMLYGTNYSFFLPMEALLEERSAKTI